jgi:hypothetical protein
MSGEGGDGCGGIDSQCGEPVTGAIDVGIVRPAGSESGVAYVNDYKITRDGVVRHVRPKTEIRPKD